MRWWIYVKHALLDLHVYHALNLVLRLTCVSKRKFYAYCTFSCICNWNIVACDVKLQYKPEVILVSGYGFKCKNWIVGVREKGRDLTQTCDKNPYTYRIIKKATWQHKNATKNFDYTTIADRLRTVSWSNSSHQTGVVKPVYERSTFPLTATAVQSKGHTFKNFVNNPPYRDWGPTANQSGEVIKMWYTHIYSNIKVYQKYRDIH